VSEPEPTRSGALPDPVRHRVIALTADALGHLASDHVPASLRRVASFAPNRRARLAGTQIAAVLEADDDFRERVATQVRLAAPDLARALDDGAPPAAGDPVEVAAVAYVLRPEGWAALVDRAGEKVAEQPTRRQDDDAIERLQRQLADARAEVKTARDKARGQLSDVKSENADLRHKLADARRRARDAEAEVASAQETRATQEVTIKDLEAEVRRLRGRISDLEANSSAAKRALRDEREQATIRTRLLLETVLESAQGLRRELALPPVAGAPADTVEAVAPAESGAAGGTRARAVDDPALLEELLALPRVHVIVDGYNVTKTAWESAPLDAQRSRLMNGLAPVVARTKADITVVFDGADLTNPPPVAGPRGVRVLFSPPGVIADVTIGQLVAAEPQGRAVVVVTSDREVAEGAARAGARSVSSTALVRLLTR